MEQLLELVEKDVFDPRTVVGAMAWAVVLLVMSLVVAHGVRLVARRAESRLSDQTGLPFITAFVQLLVHLIAFILYAHLVPELRAIGTAVLTGAGVVSIVAGLAAQNTLGNLVAGLSLVLYRPIQMGDTVQVSAPSGVITAQVARISLGFTVLRTEKREEVIVPNNVMMSTVLVRLPKTPDGAAH